MKILFTCFGCQESFTVSTENLAKKESLACPNCEKKFPYNNFHALKNLHSIIVAANEELTNVDKEGAISQHWDFKFID